MKNANKYWTKAGAAKEYGIAATTLQHACERSDIETVTTACGLTLLYGPSLRKYAKKHRPRNKISAVIRRRCRGRGKYVHAVPDSAMPDGNALCGGGIGDWGPPLTAKSQRVTCPRCKERSKNYKVL